MISPDFPYCESSHRLLNENCTGNFDLFNSYDHAFHLFCQIQLFSFILRIKQLVCDILEEHLVDVPGLFSDIYEIVLLRREHLVDVRKSANIGHLRDENHRIDVHLTEMWALEEERGNDVAGHRQCAQHPI